MAPLNTHIDARLELDATPAGVRGELRLRVGVAGARTAILDLQQSAPFHLGRLSYPGSGRAAEAIVQGVGPGYLPGDELTIDIQVESGADIVLRGQSAARIYLAPGASGTTMSMHLRVAAGGSLVFAPGELIPYRNARLLQQTTIDVCREGRVGLVEVITPGRVAMREMYADGSIDLRMKIRYDRQLTYGERSFLEPATLHPTIVGIHGPYPVSAAIDLVGEG